MHKVQQDGYFESHVFTIERVVREVRIGIRFLEEDVDYILRDAAYEIRLIEAQTAEIIRLTEEELARRAYKNRIRQPRMKREQQSSGNRYHESRLKVD